MKKFLIIFATLISVTHLRCEDMFTAKEAALFGITQGITEYLPVSSTGHLILIDEFLLEKEVAHADTIQAKTYAKNSYFAIIQFGSILAVLLLYRRRFSDMLSGVFQKNALGRQLVYNLIISFLPAAAIGFLVDGMLQKNLYSGGVVAAALIIGSAIMFFSEKLYKKRVEKSFITIEQLTIGKSLVIGLWQCLSLMPGMSRSMTTIVGGYQCGLRRTDAAEYSFLLGFVTLSAATAYKLIKDFDTIFLYFSTKTFLLGIFLAFISSVVAIKFLVAYISRHGILIFAWYRIILATAIFVFLL